MAAKLLPQERVGNCGRKAVGQNVSLVLDYGGDRGAYFAGIETCGSVWHCPVCAGKIAEGRRADIADVLTAHKDFGGSVYMLTLTVPHNAFQSARQLRDVVAGAWRKVLSGAPWKRWKRRAGVMGYIRALEVTHGGNGWHPHLHVLLLTAPMDDEDQEAIKVWLFERWAAVVERMGLKPPSYHAFRFERASTTTQAGDYVAKWGVDSELAKAHVKASRHGGRSPWQLLSDAGEGDRKAAMLFREYAAAFKGARHLTWSQGLRDIYLGTPELSDEELAAADAPFNGDAVIGEFRRGLWFRLVQDRLLPEVLNAAEVGGWSAVLALLREHRLAMPEPIPRERSWHDERETKPVGLSGR